MAIKPRISFLVPDISAPSVGAALKLAKMLEPAFSTEIIGPDFGGGICSLYRNAYPFKSVPAGKLYRFPDYGWERKRIVSAVSGDMVIAVKAFADTVPVARMLKKQRKIPFAVYLDEWDGALWQSLTSSEKVRCWLQHFHHPMESNYHAWVERMIPDADQVLSTTTWLQKRFGGEVVHAGVDCGFFKPHAHNEVAALKQYLGLSSKKVIVFGGVVRPHKGMEDILDALMRLNRDDIRILVVGPVTEHLARMVADPKAGRFLVVAGDALNSGTTINAEISKKMPLYLDVGDLIVLPLRDTKLAQSQMPIKIFEALAMRKPVIGTAVADLPLMLADCGWIVPPGDTHALAEAIAVVVDQPELARAKGHAAREKCLREFSKDVCGDRLKDIIRKVLA